MFNRFLRNVWFVPFAMFHSFMPINSLLANFWTEETKRGFQQNLATIVEVKYFLSYFKVICKYLEVSEMRLESRWVSSDKHVNLHNQHSFGRRNTVDGTDSDSEPKLQLSSCTSKHSLPGEKSSFAIGLQEKDSWTINLIYGDFLTFLENSHVTKESKTTCKLWIEKSNSSDQKH